MIIARLILDVSFYRSFRSMSKQKFHFPNHSSVRTQTNKRNPNNSVCQEDMPRIELSRCIRIPELLAYMFWACILPPVFLLAFGLLCS